MTFHIYVNIGKESLYITSRQLKKNQKIIIFFNISFEYIKYILYLCIAIEKQSRQHYWWPTVVKKRGFLVATIHE